MQHTESSVKIYYSKEYGRFRMIEGNRMLNESKINRIINDIEDGTDVLKFAPIIVIERDGRLDIVDGQHRFFVAKQLGSHVWYILAQELTLHEIAKVNSNTEKWKDRDFVNCYAQQGNEHYIKLREFRERYGFPIGVCIALLSNGLSMKDGGAKSAIKETFHQGLFVVQKEEEAHGIAAQIKLFEEFPAHKTGSFVEAITKVMRSKLIEVSELAEKWKKQPKSLEVRSNAKDYLANMEAIINLNARKRRVIYQ